MIDHEDILPGSTHWSMPISRDRLLRLLRLIDIEGGANVGMLF